MITRSTFEGFVQPHQDFVHLENDFVGFKNVTGWFTVDALCCFTDSPVYRGRCCGLVQASNQ